MLYRHAPYSYSKITLFTKCPYAWKKRYIDLLVEEKHPSLKFGAIVHEIIADYLKQLSQRKENVNHALLEKIINEHLEEDEVFFEQIQKLLPALQSIVLPPGISPQIELPVALNEQFETCDFYSDDAFLRGKIDYFYIIDDTAVIIDWKTDQHLPQSDESEMQTRFYALLLEPTLPPEVEKFVVELNYLRFSKVKKTVLTREALNEVKEWILQKVEQVEKEEKFDPTPGDWCEVCGYVSQCPYARVCLTLSETKLSQIPEKVSSIDEAVELAGVLKMIDLIREKLKNLLKEWVAEHGPIQLSGEVLGFHQTETVKWETPEQKAALAALLVRNGVNKEEIWDLFSTSKTAVCSFLKRHNLKHLLEEALATGEKSVYERFCFRKKGGERT